MGVPSPLKPLESASPLAKEPIEISIIAGISVPILHTPEIGLSHPTLFSDISENRLESISKGETNGLGSSWFISLKIVELLREDRFTASLSL
jgi:hypothetical protein